MDANERAQALVDGNLVLQSLSGGNRMLIARHIADAIRAAEAEAVAAERAAIVGLLRTIGTWEGCFISADGACVVPYQHGYADGERAAIRAATKAIEKRGQEPSE